jgi:hypothetical protein
VVEIETVGDYSPLKQPADFKLPQIRVFLETPLTTMDEGVAGR